MHKRGLRSTGALATAMAAVLFFAAPVSAESIDITIGECEADGTRQMTFAVDSASEQVQWIVDGSEFFGGPTAADAQSIFVQGDDNSHSVQAVTVPGGVLVERVDLVIPSCDAGAAGQTTTVTPATTVPADRSTTTVERSADLFPAWVAGIPDGDPDGGLVVRTGPDTSNAQIDVLPNGTGVVALGDPAASGWVEIISPVNGWVSTVYLSKISPAAGATTVAPSTTAPPSTTGTTSAPREDSTPATADPNEIEPDATEQAGESSDDAAASASTSIPAALAATDDTGSSGTSNDEGGLPLVPILGGLGLLIAAGAVALGLKSRSSKAPAETTAAPVADAAAAAPASAAMTAAGGGSATLALNSATKVSDARTAAVPATLPEPSDTSFMPATPERGSTKPARRKTDRIAALSTEPAANPPADDWDPAQLAAAVAAAKQRPEVDSGEAQLAGRSTQEAPPEATPPHSAAETPRRRRTDKQATPTAAMSQEQREAALRLLSSEEPPSES